ncbi:hypothetical protein ACQUJS_19905, partial [Ralstonia pseudosolanacearum]
LERHHLEFVLGGRRALEHPAIKYKGLAEGEAFVSNLRPNGCWAFFFSMSRAVFRRAIYGIEAVRGDAVYKVWMPISSLAQATTQPDFSGIGAEC